MRSMFSKSKVLFVVSVALFLSSGTCKKNAPSRRPHWLDIPESDWTEDENRKWEYLSELQSMLDDDNDGSISRSELLDSIRQFMGEDMELPTLKILLTGDPSIMHSNVFDDMWWIMAHRPGVKVDEDTDIALLFFSHADTNDDDRIDKEELHTLLKMGGRTKETPTMKGALQKLITTMDKDDSKTLTQLEVWSMLMSIIRIEGETTMYRDDIAGLLHYFSNTTKETVNFEGLMMCMDGNQDGNVSLDEEVDFVEQLDMNYNEVIDEHELIMLHKLIGQCVDDYLRKHRETRDINKPLKPESKPMPLLQRLRHRAMSKGKQEDDERRAEDGGNEGEVDPDNFKPMEDESIKKGAKKGDKKGAKKGAKKLDDEL